MIVVIDDRIIRINDRFNASFIFESPLIKHFAHVPKIEDCIDATVICIHDSIAPDGMKEDLIDLIGAEGIPVILFSNGAEYESKKTLYGWELNADDFYSNLNLCRDNPQFEILTRGNLYLNDLLSCIRELEILVWKLQDSDKIPLDQNLYDKLNQLELLIEGDDRTVNLEQLEKHIKNLKLAYDQFDSN